MLRFTRGPMQTGTKNYNGYTAVRFDVDTRARRVTLHLGPVNEEAQYLRLGKLVREGSKLIARVPKLLRTMTIEDSQQGDPALLPLFRKCQEMQEEIEKILVANRNDPEGITTLTYQDGEDEWNLDAEFVSTLDKPWSLEKI